MDIKELKEKIKSKQITLPLIFKYSDNNFLCKQYLNEICKILSLEKTYIQSFNDILDTDAFFVEEPSCLYVYEIDKLENLPDGLPNNLIIICNKIVKIDVDYIIDFPKVESWQIEAYVKAVANGLNDNEIKNLCETCKYDIFRIDQECNKLKLFTSSNQSSLLNQLISENNFIDLTPLTIFNFTNALIKKDLNAIHDILCDLVHIDVEGTGVVTILYRNFKNMIDIKMNPKASAYNLNLKPAQFNAIKWNCAKYTNEQLINIFEFLTNIDSKIKNGDLQFSDYGDEGNKHLINNNHLVDYLTTQLMGLAL